MKLDELDKNSLLELERIIGNLLIDMDDLLMSELHDKILEMLGK